MIFNVKFIGFILLFDIIDAILTFLIIYGIITANKICLERNKTKHEFYQLNKLNRKIPC